MLAGLAPLALTLVTTASPAAAQGFSFGPSKADATLYGRVEASEVRVAIEVEIDAGWHLYHDDLGHPEAIGKPTVVTLEPATVEWSAVRFPEPKRVDQSDLIEGAWINAHEGTIVLYALGRIPAGATVDAGALETEITGLTCEDGGGSCIPYSQSLASEGGGPDALFASFPDDLVPSAGGATATPPSASVGEAAPPPGGLASRDYASVEFPDFRPQVEAPAHGLLVWLLIAFVAGMILNVMPCVLPVISIKVLSFVQQSGEDRRRVFTLGLAFAAGILVVFVGLAVLAVGLGLSWGEQFQSQTFLVVMIGVVFAFALWLFGVYELGVPAGVGMAASTQREGHGDAFFKGMLATALATPCSGPFLGSTLTWTLGQPPLVVFAVFLALGLGMALPWPLAGAGFSALPRPGAWMVRVKQAMGVFILAMAAYYGYLSYELLSNRCAW